MAKFYGKSSAYLLKNDAKYYFLSGVLILLPLCLVWLAFKFLPVGWTLAITMISLLFVVKLSEPFIDFFRNKSNKFYRGWGGELDVKRELKYLSDDFSVFQDLKIGSNKGNIDFVVTGPSGVFLLEVKSHKGKIDHNGYSLTLNGRNWDFLRQVHGEIWALKNYLKQACGGEIYIHPALVFSSRYTSMHFGFRPISNVYVIQINFLLRLFEQFPPQIYPRENIEKALLAALNN